MPRNGRGREGGDELKRRRLPLTTRQREVGRLLRAGRSYKQIATALEIEHGTVRTHVEQLYRRLGISSRWDLLDIPARMFTATSDEVRTNVG